RQLGGRDQRLAAAAAAGDDQALPVGSPLDQHRRVAALEDQDGGQGPGVDALEAPPDDTGDQRDALGGADEQLGRQPVAAQRDARQQHLRRARPAVIARQEDQAADQGVVLRDRADGRLAGPGGRRARARRRKLRNRPY